MKKLVFGSLLGLCLVFGETEEAFGRRCRVARTSYCSSRVVSTYYVTIDGRVFQNGCGSSQNVVYYQTQESTVPVSNPVYRLPSPNLK